MIYTAFLDKNLLQWTEGIKMASDCAVSNECLFHILWRLTSVNSQDKTNRVQRVGVTCGCNTGVCHRNACRLRFTESAPAGQGFMHVTISTKDSFCLSRSAFSWFPFSFLSPSFLLISLFPSLYFQFHLHSLFLSLCLFLFFPYLFPSPHLFYLLFFVPLSR